MHYTSIVAGLALLPAAFAGPVPASGAPLHALAARSDPHKLDFRTFGASGCSAKNQGVYTLLQSDAGACRPFAEPIGSLLVGDNLCTCQSSGSLFFLLHLLTLQ